MKLWRSLRVRLTSAFLLLAFCAVAVAAIATALLVEQATVGTLDAVLLEEATTLAGFIDLPRERLVAAVDDIGSETDMGPGKFVSVTAADGTSLASSQKIPRSVAERRPRNVTAPKVATVGEDDAMFRVAWAPTKAGGAVAVGIHASRYVRLVERARWAISLLAVALLVVLGVGAWAITGRATQELDRLTDEVATIEAGSLERRLSVRRTDEVDRLVGVLNRVLGRLERSVAQLRRFTADAAHELRTPLAAMRARLEVALCRDGTTVPRDVVMDALEQTERLGRLAEDLLMLARMEGGAVSAITMDATVDVTTLVEEVATAMAPVAEEQSRPLRWHAASDLVARGSEPLLKRVLLNLIDNAFRHTSFATPVEIDAYRDDGDVVIEVRDQGPGIDPALLPHAFERFRHGAGGGSGLGLALVREIVECHRGIVTLESTAGTGTCVRVTLAAARAGASPEPEIPSGPGSSHAV
jgi:two-component system OmpR family sensor kinase